MLMASRPAVISMAAAIFISVVVWFVAVPLLMTPVQYALAAGLLVGTTGLWASIYQRSQPNGDVAELLHDTHTALPVTAVSSARRS
jgi:uncharacterized protein YqfA (UPF0365 family)